MKEIQLTKGYIALVDDKDFEKVNTISWHVVLRKDKQPMCAQGWTKGSFKLRKRLKMHRFILNLNNPNMVVDHINCNSLDNRRHNLRICKQSENCKNLRKLRKTKSIYKGVSWHTQQKKWSVRINVDKKIIHLGTFNNDKDAAHVYNVAAVKYFKQFANLNVLN